jgi:non-specific serine/threonine protein kinase
VARAALERHGAGAPTKQRSSALYAAGILAYARGVYDDVGRCWEESLAISREIGDRTEAARATMGLGTLAVAEGRPAAARAHFEEAIEAAREAGTKAILGAALNGLAELHRVEGDLDRAKALYEESLTLFREEGSFNVAVIVLNLAMVAISQGDLVASQSRLAEAARLAEEADSKFAGWGVLEVTASLAAASGHAERAARIWGASDSARARGGRSLAPGDEQFLLPWIDRARSALGDAAFTRAASDGRALSYEDALSEARVWLEVGESGIGA